ncbi:TfoX/Sxy family protein [Cellvibrio sp.]|uniref:TfoX/Sxy family protein n=1 Tax=Cellvibrio sp. TaxID=1965322 RepID=UPI003964782B
MTVSSSFLLSAVESMSQVAPVSYRRIFNGYGIYHQGVQFAIVIHDHLYFRADDYSRSLYIAKRMTAFLPSTIETGESNFFQVPEEVLNQPDELIFWMRIAVEAAQGGYSLEDDEPDSISIPVRHLKVR